MQWTVRMAALHSVLWGFDRWYRISWYVWPSAAALLISGWICLDKPSGPSGVGVSGANWAKSLTPSAGATGAPADPLKPELDKCFSKFVVGVSAATACSGLISAGKVKGRQLAEVLTQRGFLQRESYPNGALADFDEALKIQPDLADALSNRAWLSMQHQQYDAALADLNKAVELSPPPASAATVRYYRGYAFLRLQDYTKALADLNEALRLRPFNPDFHLARAEAEQALQNYDGALRDADDVIKYIPRDARGFIQRASALKAMGRLQEALAALDKAVTLQPGNDYAASERDELRAQLESGDQSKKEGETQK